MALSGNLAEFDISNIFLLIEQDGKTGKLIISSQNDREVVIFKQGQIINVYNEKEDIKEFVFRYLRHVKGVSAMEISELNAIYYRNIKLLSDELVTKGYLSQQELITIVQTAIIDVASEVFSVKYGEYIFDQHPTVDSYQFLNIALPANFIMLEAARRSDEWSSVAKELSPDAVFVIDPQGLGYAPHPVPPIENFGEYALTLVNGTRTIKDIGALTFFSNFNIYMSFSNALGMGRIRLVSSPDMASLRELQEANARRAEENTHVAFSAILTVVMVIVIAILGRFVYFDLFLHAKTSEASYLHNTLVIEAATHKVKAAKLLYRQQHQKDLENPRELVKKGYITSKELKLFLKNKE